MTLIAGVVAQNGKVWLGGDSGWDAEFGHRGSGISATGVMPLPKVHRVSLGGNYPTSLVWGACGNWAACQVIHRRMQWPNPPKATDDDDRDERFMWNVRDAILEVFYGDRMTDREYETHTDPDEEGLLAFEVLVGFRGVLWAIDGSGSVGKGDCDWAAIGSGALCASGALHATHCVPDPGERLSRAFAATTYTMSVIQPPYEIVTT